MKKFIIGLLVGLVVGIPSIAVANHVFDQTINVHQGSGGRLHRWDDPNFQVKCWELEDSYGAGLSCLPWSEIKER